LTSDPSDRPAIDAAPPPPAEPGEHAELRRQGAKAAARGEALAANPMLEVINQPGATGETPPVWAARRDAWDHGHGAQRPPAAVPPGAAGGASDGRSGDPSGSSRAPDEALFGVTRVLTFAGSRGLTTASGFFFERDGRLYLVTSRHVLFDAPSGHAPDRIEIELHTHAQDLTQRATVSILLYRQGVAVWHQAKDSGGEVDVAVLQVDRAALPAARVLQPFGPQHLPEGFDRFEVGDRLAIPGFPLGFFDTVHHLPVVRQASVASAYGTRFQGLGIFLTDARMHRGSSGSPVLARVDAPGPGRPSWCLLGVHSSRMDMASRDTAQDESLGLNCAWYADVLMALTEEPGTE
jgi:hypothetical protein